MSGRVGKPLGHRQPLPVELREVREKLQRGCVASADKLEQVIAECKSPRDLAALIKLQFEFAFGRPSTWVEQNTGLPETWNSLTPAGKQQVLDERIELLKRMREAVNLNVQ